MKKSIIFILVLTLFSCSTSIDNVTITQVESNYPIIIGFVPSQDSIGYIAFPLAFRISQNSFGEMRISSCTYFFNSKHRYTGRNNWRGDIVLWAKDHENLVCPTKDNTLIEIKRKPQEFVSYVYYNDLTKEAQRLIHGQIKSTCIATNKDTIHWKSIQELKQTSPEFIRNFLQNDSVSFSFRYRKLYGEWELTHINLLVEDK